MLMYKEDGGFHLFSSAEVEQALKDGWVAGQELRDKLVDAKRTVSLEVAKPIESATIPATRNRGFLRTPAKG